jgi:hypothetical protein
VPGIIKEAPDYNTFILFSDTIPDTVKIRAGRLRHFDGLLVKKTVQKVFDNLDLLRGIDDSLNLIPMTSLKAVRAGHPEIRRRCDNISDGDCRRRPGHS